MWYGFCRNLYGVNGVNPAGGVIMFLGIIAVGIVIFLLLKNKNNNIFQGASDTKSAQEILKQRLAKGEIDEDTYTNLLNKIKY